MFFAALFQKNYLTIKTINKLLSKSIYIHKRMNFDMKKIIFTNFDFLMQNSEFLINKCNFNYVLHQIQTSNRNGSNKHISFNSTNKQNLSYLYN